MSRIHVFGDISVPLLDVVMSLSTAIDIVSADVTAHHKRVAYIAGSIAHEMGLDTDDISDIVMAGMLHDVGVLSMSERAVLARFDDTDLQQHADVGYRLLKGYEPFHRISNIIRDHHQPWRADDDRNIDIGAHILHLADRIDILIERKKHVLTQTTRVVKQIRDHCSTVFHPKAVEAFMTLSDREYFWLGITYGMLEVELARLMPKSTIRMGMQELLALSTMFSRLIDFRSPFTASHSAGVAAVSKVLAEVSGMSKRQCQMMEIAGFLHDLGKIAIPTELLEKEGPLTDEEFAIVRSHTYYTYRILEPIEELSDIRYWAAFHHERLDGTGYPFKLNDESLTRGSRILAVADVFTALREDRPYRTGIDLDRVVEVLREMCADNHLDASIVDLAIDKLDIIEHARFSAGVAARDQYAELTADN